MQEKVRNIPVVAQVECCLCPAACTGLDDNMFIQVLCFAHYVDAAVDHLSHILCHPHVPVALFTWAVLLEDFVQLGRTDLVGVIQELCATMTRGIAAPISMTFSGYWVSSGPDSLHR